MNDSVKKIAFSGIQPTGGFTLGNYIGALRNWKKLQQDMNCIYCVVDLHSITVRNDPKELRQKIKEATAMLIAAGIDPKQSIIFEQSHVSQHAELAWILSCYTQFGELSRMTQFKDKSQRHPENINAGLFTYPILMASDILLYNADYVPIGNDQKQHLELSRDVAIRFNGIYGDTFVVPEGYFPTVGGRVMSLQDPTSKMSKSDSNVNARIMMSDSDDVIMKKFKRAVTDSESVVRAGEGKEGIENLMSIYSSITGKSFSEIELEFEGQGYGAFKTAVGETVVSALSPIRNEFQKVLADESYINEILKTGSEKASVVASRTLKQVYEVLGFIAKPL